MPTNEKSHLLLAQQQQQDEYESKGSGPGSCSSKRVAQYLGIAALIALLGMAGFQYYEKYQPASSRSTTRGGRRKLNVAFLGNSMMYKNDLPRLFERISGAYQDSCLHPNASLYSLIEHGNGVFEIFNTTNALIEGTDFFDFGQCTVYQVLVNERDSSLRAKINRGHSYTSESDLKNPCLQQPEYLDYLESQPKSSWDFVVMNDNTRSPGRMETRQNILQVLNESYVPWLSFSGAVPVFLDTHAYDGVEDDAVMIQEMFGNVSYFTAVTYQGYEEYQALLASRLPKNQQPRIAPSGIAFLTVWEENYELWTKMFNDDNKHASPYGTFVQALVIYQTIYGRMPKNVLQEDMSSLFSRSRQFDDGVQFPSLEEAEILYDVAERVTMEGYRPQAFVEEMARLEAGNRL